jgi:hypothetical protein
MITTSILIIAFSAILLIYWFRYCCILLIRTHAEQQAVSALACDSQFSFNNVRERLRSESELDALCRSLDRDYALFSYLLGHAAGLGATSLEDRLLVIDYKVMQGWYRLTKTAAPEQARNALDEMATVLGLLVGKMGERAAAQSQA